MERASRLLILILALITWGSAAAAPQVVTSIAPIHNLVHGVMEGVAEPVRLVPPGASPHTYRLRPSDMRRLHEADVVVWIGPEMETFLVRPLATAPQDLVRVSLMEDADLIVHPRREGGLWEHRAHGDGDARGHDDPGHDHRDVDTHVWLSPENAARITRHVAAVLARTDPDNAQRYRANRERILAELQALDAQIAKRLAPVRERPFIVFHDAYQYFERHYDLHPAGSITLDPSRSVGARRIHEIRERIRGAGALCVFVEPQFEPDLVHTLVEGTDARTGVLDPLGAELPPGVESYYRLLRDLADHLVDCLSRDGADGGR
ncbi:zinc transport system substrate-binding protein [Ectothiorhodospira mobilis]|uniref:High-affinity zinc uptake system protein ZnuA n=1 Tax=Ectothiorhodospira mobilis TaxID=195064 RepID=A0A1I4QUC8_ECTMO|nr:zinc ABC transporter substrate-binding protein ZnuA [Ectothiorhodospira mobilis]SFM43692.1 zinc transport system substrate-binding protein [Ectothiorhodospira mobilis]